MSSRQTPTSKRSPSILVTDVRHEEAHSAPFVHRRLNAVSVDSLLVNTSEVPSAQRRVVPRRRLPQSTTNYGSSARRSPMAGGTRRPDLEQQAAADTDNVDAAAGPRRRRPSESTPLLSGHSSSSANGGGTGSSASQRRGSSSAASGISTGVKSQQGRHLKPVPPKPVPQLSKPLPSRTSKQSQRLVLIPEAADGAEPDESDLETQQPEDSMRLTSYLISEGVLLPQAAEYLKREHRARVRLYDEALFADYLLPLHPGNGVGYRIRSSVGDNRTMERMIDMSEAGDHHFEYFSGSATEETDPSEPQDFSPRPAPTPLSHDTSEGAISGNASESSYDGQSSTSGRSSPPQESGGIDHEQEQRELENERRIATYKSHAELFVFNYGVVVFWNFTEAQEKQILADLSIGSESLVVNPLGDQEIEVEELKFAYGVSPETRPRIFNDLIMLNNNSHMLKLAMSHAMAQSTILCGFEERMQSDLKDVRGVPKTLALTGKLGLNREQLLKISGRLFKLRVDVNLSSNVLDIPEFFWDSEPSLFPLFNALREYLEIDERVLVMNERQAMFLELTSVLGDSIAEFNMDRITIYMIWLIVLSICVSLTEIFMRFIILRRAK